jgi:NAD(P)-dependent dehydrogenase (short-subunit alcohol dehydrogenase family)
MDLSSLSTVVAAANAFKARESRLHILLNNAGIMATPYGTTTNGFEVQLGTNYVGHFLLTKLLTPMLIATAKEVGQEGVVRVVNLGSIAHSFATAGIEFDDMHHEKGNRSEWTRYGVVRYP